MEETYDHMKDLQKSVRNYLGGMYIEKFQKLTNIGPYFPVDDNERRRIQNLVEDIRSEGPMTGCGYFSVTRGSLTSMFSITITYVIILIQFNQSEGGD